MAKIISPVPEKVAKTLAGKPHFNEQLASEKACTQIRYTNGEFITDSYAMAKDQSDLENLLKSGSYKGMQLWDVSRPVVKFDDSLQIFWVNTGFFD
jgi:hypothetical protein